MFSHNCVERETHERGENATQDVPLNNNYMRKTNDLKRIAA